MGNACVKGQEDESAVSEFYRLLNGRCKSEIIDWELSADDEAQAIGIFHRQKRGILTSTGREPFSTPFHAAAAAGSHIILRELISFVLSDEKENPFHTLPLKKKHKRLRSFLQRFSKTSRMCGPRTPLMLSATYGRTECVKLLVENGADLLAQEGIMPEDEVTTMTDIYIPTLSKPLAGLSSLHLAARGGHTACIHALLTTDLPPGSPSTIKARVLEWATSSGLTALHFAVAFFKQDCVEALLGYNANLLAKTVDLQLFGLGTFLLSAHRDSSLMYLPIGTTPLHIAGYSNNLPAATALLRRHLTLNARVEEGLPMTTDLRYVCDSIGRLPIHAAANRGISRMTDERLIELLTIETDLYYNLQVQQPFGPQKLLLIAADAFKAKLYSDLSDATGSGSGSGRPISKSGVRVLASSSSFLSSGPSSPSPSSRNNNVEATSPVADERRSSSAVTMKKVSINKWEGVSNDKGGEAGGASLSCLICFDAQPMITIKGCEHCVCSTCAKSLVETLKPKKLLLCPFCRVTVSGFA